MPKRVLLQIDGDDHPSAFDSIVAIDANVDELLRFGGVRAESVTDLVHGAMFTRGGDRLKNTAIFFGGSDVGDAEKLFQAAQAAFFGPVRVSVMLDANGCNTTASAAVVAASRHVELRQARAVVLGGTGPVGQRVAQLLASEDAEVTLTSRSRSRAEEASKAVSKRIGGGRVGGEAAGSADDLRGLIRDARIVIACGAAGVQLIDEDVIREATSLAVAVDLNAVPPAGIGGVGVTDKAAPLGTGVAYGAVGVGGLKMRTHKRAIETLFESNDRVLDAPEIYAIAKSIG